MATRVPSLTNFWYMSGKILQIYVERQKLLAKQKYCVATMAQISEFSKFVATRTFYAILFSTIRDSKKGTFEALNFPSTWKYTYIHIYNMSICIFSRALCSSKYNFPVKNFAYTRKVLSKLSKKKKRKITSCGIKLSLIFKISWKRGFSETIFHIIYTREREKN